MFPQKSLLAARIGTLGTDTDWIGDYAQVIFERQFAEGNEIERPESHIALLNALGQPGEQIVEQARADEDNKLRLRQHTELAQKIGLFGAPSFVTEDDEVFWGDDRLEDAIDWALKQI